MTEAILVVNAGSSSVKFSLFKKSDDLQLFHNGSVSGIGAQPSFVADENAAGAGLPAGLTHEDALRHVLNWIKTQKHGAISVVAHRVVHGGIAFKTAAMVTPEILARLQNLAPLAPLHQPHNLAAIGILSRLMPDVPQVACFDTAFHAGHDPLFARYAVPRELEDKGVRRYGFHGLSYAWIAQVLRREHPELARGRVIAAHLGNGASLCAMKNGVSIDTTMGMTALEGLPMGTRCGSIDPGAVLFMIRNLGLTVEQAEHMLYNDSGLKGLSGISNDVRTLLTSDAAAAEFALDYFSLQVARFTGLLTVALGGIDGFVFTGGIGEHAAPVRARILRHLEFLQPFETLVIPANEERVMAQQALQAVAALKTATPG